MSRILLLEDDLQIGEGLVTGLAHFGMTVDWFIDGNQGRAALTAKTTQTSFDAVILDLGLPHVDGMTILAHWRQQKIATPVLILTARDAIDNRVAGLNAGADDYLVKPFALAEVIARLQALMRRYQGRSQNTLSYGNLSFNPVTRIAYLKNQPLTLTAKEATLLELLLSTPHQVYSRAQLEDKLYGWAQEVDSNAIEVHIHHLRKKITTHFIVTQRGIGYRLGVAP